MRLLITLILISLFPLAGYGRRQQTTIRKSHATTAPAPSSAGTSLPVDTITAGLGSLISMAGYDKPLSASRETLHLTNLSATDTITSITLDITYLDRKNRQLHRREVTVNDLLAPGETSLISFPTWDTQRSFYYILSVKPRRQATPYSVIIKPLAATITRR